MNGNYSFPRLADFLENEIGNRTVGLKRKHDEELRNLEENKKTEIEELEFHIDDLKRKHDEKLFEFEEKMRAEIEELEIRIGDLKCGYESKLLKLEERKKTEVREEVKRQTEAIKPEDLPEKLKAAVGKLFFTKWFSSVFLRDE